MPKSINRVTLLGNIGKDPDTRFTPGGMAVARFSVATNDRFKDKDGEYQDKVEWHNIVAFGKTAEVVEKYLRKGSKVYIEGKLQTSSWDDRESGEKKYKTEIVLNELVMLDGKPEASEESRSESRRESTNEAKKSGSRTSRPVGDSTEVTDDDLDSIF